MNSFSYDIQSPYLHSEGPKIVAETFYFLEDCN